MKINIILPLTESSVPPPFKSKFIRKLPFQLLNVSFLLTKPSFLDIMERYLLMDKQELEKLGLWRVPVTMIQISRD
jgi:hypothetical protein